MSRSRHFYVVLVAPDTGEPFITRSWARLENAVRQARTLLSVSSTANRDDTPTHTVTIVRVD